MESSCDYFTLKPVRGLSPTTSLAADLSQNFHIEQSAPFATPRRSLFSAALCGAIGGREMTTTPPLPSSSPGPGFDSMDISPLPHKAPFSTLSRFELKSITPVARNMSSAMDQDMTTPTHTFKLPLPERRRPSLLKPSVARTARAQVIPLPQRSATADGQMQPFKFGSGIKSVAMLSATTTTITTTMAAISDKDSFTSSTSASLIDDSPLGNLFPGSPARARRASAAAFLEPPITFIGPSRQRQPFSSVVAHARNGFPLAGHVRKPSAPPPRPRKIFRRSLSMFEHPGDVLKEESPVSSKLAAPMPSIMDIDDPPKLLLPHFIPEDKPDSLPRISRETLIDVLDGRYAELYEQSIIVDCRFEYEYEGGHIDGALNFNDKDELATKLFEKENPPKTLLVFHCEYSAHRAPNMAEYIRCQDRSTNGYRYPLLTYPEVYILDGGYSAFFGEHRNRCVPQNYIGMNSTDHVNTCEREMGKLRHRKKLNRAQTFAFGQYQHPVDDSPTAPGRAVTNTMMTTLENRRMHTQRMASY